MAVIPVIKDEDIFIKTNSLTNTIKGKKLRKRLFDYGIKVEIKKDSYPVHIGLGVGFNKDVIKFVFHHPESMHKDTLNDIVHLVSEAIWRRYDIGQRYEYVKI